MKIIFLIVSAFSDLFIRHLPQIKKREGFAFLVHPRDTADVSRKYPFSRFFPDILVMHALKRFWPVTLSSITGTKNKKTGKQIPGWVISIPITAEQMMHDRELAKKFIIKAARLAERKGARIIGLGALTASLTRGGLDIIPHTKAHITTGRLYTAQIVTGTTIEASKRLSLDKDNVEVGIVGAGGSIGTASAQILARGGFNKFVLVDLSGKEEKMGKLISILKSLNPNVSVEYKTSINAINNSDIVIAVTNKPDALIRSENLKPGAVVVDDAQPSDVEESILRDRRDVLVLEGGVAHTSIVNTHFNFGLKHKEDIFSCLAETIILSMNGSTEEDFQVGEMLELNFNALENLVKQGEDLGFRIADFQNVKKVYTDNDVSYVREVIHGKRHKD